MGGQGSPGEFYNFTNYASNLKQIFLNELAARQSEITPEIMTQIDKDLDITHTLDPECKAIWFPLGIRIGFAPVLDKAHTFICDMGRMKYLNPIYQALLDSDQHDLAV